MSKQKLELPTAPRSKNSTMPCNKWHRLETRVNQILKRKNEETFKTTSVVTTTVPGKLLSWRVEGLLQSIRVLFVFAR